MERENGDPPRSTKNELGPGTTKFYYHKKSYERFIFYHHFINQSLKVAYLITNFSRWERLSEVAVKVKAPYSRRIPMAAKAPWL
jgi:hypothetical protein